MATERVAIVVGGASGIGWATAKALAADGCRVIVAKHAGRQLGEGGVLVSISSLNGRQPAAGMSAYCAAKAGLSMLTQVAALELGPRGIRVNAIAPGFVHTPLTEAAASDRESLRSTSRTPRWAGRAHPRTSRTPWCSSAPLKPLG